MSYFSSNVVVEEMVVEESGGDGGSGSGGGGGGCGGDEGVVASCNYYNLKVPFLIEINSNWQIECVVFCTDGH